MTRAELVGLVPESVLQSVPAHRWTELDLDADRTIEARLAARPRRTRCCGEPRPLATDAATLTLAHAAPDAELLAVGERVLEALHAHDATAADLFGLARRSAALGEEQVRVDAEAVGVVLPAAVLRIERGLDALHRCGLPPAAGRVQSATV